MNLARCSDEFLERIRKMSDEELLTLYRERYAKYEALDAERITCWDRMQEIFKEQDVMSPELSALNIVVHFSRKLKP